jgi:hypothetical protein
LRSLIFAFLAISSASLSAQHYVSEPPKPVSKKLYENKPPSKNTSTHATRYTASLLDQIHRRVTLHDYHRGKSCGLFFTIDLDRRHLVELTVSNCTMGRDFEQQLPQILSKAIYATPVPKDTVSRVIIQRQAITFVPRFNAPVKSDKPSSFSKTYVTPQK